MVSAWIGTVRISWRIAVTIVAVQERPGLSSCGGLSKVTTTLKSFASWAVEVFALTVPLLLVNALFPTSETRPIRTRSPRASTLIRAS